ncbi:MAG: hypothetical protein AAGG46_03315 [Planctomycetota bacterium]
MLLAEFLPTLMFAAGCALLTMIMIRLTYKRIGRRRPRRNEPAIDAQPRPTGAWSGAQADASARISRQEVELHDRSREVTAQIDSKMIMLRELIAQSDEQIARLETLLAEAEDKQEPQMHTETQG